jgi:chromosome segregation ATPase
LAQKFRSVPIAQIAIRARADPFAKVRSMIRDMLKKLKVAKDKDAEEHGYCQKEQAANKKKLTKIDNEIEKNSGRVATATAAVGDAKKELAQLQGDSQEAAQTIQKATGIRSANKVSNRQVMEKAEHDSMALANAVSSMEGALKKVVEGIKSDIDERNAQTETLESQQSAAHDKAVQDNKVNAATNSANQKAAERAIASNKSRIEELNGDLNDLDTSRKSEAAVEAQLMKRCTKKTMSFEERAARRQAEIDGLKSAIKILNEEAA